MNRTLRRIVFGLYAAALLYGTHGPRRDVNVAGIERPDLIVHLCAFAGFFVLLLAAEFFGPWRSARGIGVCTLIATAFAAVNEATQALPVFGRTSALDDFAANIGGIALGVVGAVVAARVRGRRGRRDKPEEPRPKP